MGQPTHSHLGRHNPLLPCAALLSSSEILDYDVLIAQTSCCEGGLGILYPSHHAAPDFVITMAQSLRYVIQGFQLNDDLEPFRMNESIQQLYLRALNPGSEILQRFDRLLDPIAEVPVSPKCPPN